MTKWTKSRRDPGRNYLDDEVIERKRKMMAKIYELVDCGFEAESQVIEVAKQANPKISEEDLKDVITLFRDAVCWRQRGQ